MPNFNYRFRECLLESIPNDMSIRIVSYLSDSDDQPFLNASDGTIDTFDVQTYRSALPPSGYADFLSIMANRFIGEKYNVAIGGTTVAGSTVVTLSEESTATTDELVPGQYVFGDGIPVDAAVRLIRNRKSFELNEAAATGGQVSLTFSANGWTIDYSEIARLVSIVNFDQL
jgi:hypothetical protein